MSLFDVIRYPISDVPTLEELEAIPDEIFNQWGIVKELSSGPTRQNVWYVINESCKFQKLRSGYFNPHRAEELRKIIREYNDDI